MRDAETSTKRSTVAFTYLLIDWLLTKWIL